MDAADDMIGREVVSRRITRKLGEGGMGAVYFAEHPTLVSTPYVVKVLHPEFARHADIVDRLFQEAQTASAIKHPAIIDIIDTNRFADGRPYIVMAFVPGVDLGEHCHVAGGHAGHPGRLRISLATPVVLQLLDGLRAAHERGVIHRDLKLSNVMVVMDGPHGIAVKILDFGIAKPPEDLRVAPPTATHQVFGTPGYMPPEQARGQKIDARADVYAVGVMLYRILTGEPPFSGATAGDLLLNQLTVQPKAPIELVREIPAAVSDLIVECLASEPALRPGTVTEVATRWINAVPGARDLAKSLAPGLLSNTGSGDPTIQGTRAGGARAAIIAAPVQTAVPKSAGTPMAGAIGTMPPSEVQRAKVSWMTAVWNSKFVANWGWGKTAVAIGCALGLLVAALILTSPKGEGEHIATTPQVGIDAAPRAPVSPPPDAAPLPVVDAAPPTIEDALVVPPDAAMIDAGRAGSGSGRPPRPPTSKDPGALEIRATPWAEVWIDGTYKGTTPVTVVEIASGAHTVKLKRPDGGTEQVRVTVRAGKTSKITREFTDP